MFQELKALVIGGINMDVLGMTDSPFTLGDSLPGKVVLQPGGVGRNIANRLVESGAKVELLTALGTDSLSQILLQSCQELGIDLKYALQLPGSASIYLAIHGQDGNMVSAINDMSAMDKLNPSHIQRALSAIDQMDVCVLDANPSQAVLQTALEQLDVPFILDPVSAVKCMKLLPLLANVYALKPNLMEAQAMTGKDQPGEAADELLQRGVQQVFISLGPNGIYYASREAAGQLPALPLPTVALTGAGDAMTAGLALGLAQGLDIKETAGLGLRSAHQYLLKQIP